MTVSRVINHYPNIRPETRKKVMGAIAKIGYEPNQAARALKGMPNKTIGLVVPDLSDFFATCFHAIQTEAMNHGYQTMVGVTGRDAAIEDQQVELMMQNRVAGLIVVSSGSPLAMLAKSKLPVVALDRAIPSLNVDSVTADNREGAALGTKHLLEHGHKRIVCLAFEPSMHTVHERIAGYKDAMRDAGLKPKVVDNLNSLAQVEAVVERWSAAADRPTAVFSAQRLTTIRLIQSLYRYKISVPQQIALVGFDDFELAEALSSPVSVVAQSPRELSRTAVDILFRHIESHGNVLQSEPRSVRMVYPTTLIPRASCGCEYSSH